MSQPADSALRQAWAASLARLPKREQIRRAETVLPERFMVFREFRPLAVGIHAALVAALPEFDPAVLQRAIQLHCSRARYLKAVRAGGERWTLEGLVAGQVSEAEQLHASQRLQAMDAQRQGETMEDHEASIAFTSTPAEAPPPAAVVPEGTSLIWEDEESTAVLAPVAPVFVAPAPPPVPASVVEPVVEVAVVARSPWLACTTLREESARAERPQPVFIGDRRLTPVGAVARQAMREVSVSLRTLCEDLGGDPPPPRSTVPAGALLAAGQPLRRRQPARHTHRPRGAQFRVRKASQAARNQPVSIKVPPMGVI